MASHEYLEFIKKFIDSLPGYASLKDSNSTYITCNHPFMKMAGYTTKHEVIGKTDLDLPWKEQATAIQASDKLVLARKSPTITEEEKSLSPHKKIILMTSRSLLLDNNQLLRILSISWEMTKSQQKKDDTSQQQLALENILDNIPAHIFWKDKNCILLGCNDLQAKHMGFLSGKEMVGKNNYDVIWPEQPEEERKKQADAITKIDREVMRTGKTHIVEEPLTLPDGSVAIYLSKKTPLRNHQGDIVGILGIAFDITDKKKAEKELDEVQHKLSGMIVVSSSIAHELRTPLASLNLSCVALKNYLSDLITGYKIARDAGLPIPIIDNDCFDSLHTLTDTMKDEIKYASTFIDMQLTNLNYSTALSSGSETTSITDCIHEALERYPFEAKQRQLININDEQDFFIQGKKLLVIHILFNLIKNALYAVQAAGRGNISISLLTNDNRYNILKFKDTGTGISSEILPKIFERFFTQKHNGAGIGLTFCKSAMEMLGGDIHCDSVEGKYTCFTLYFPKSSSSGQK